MMDQRDNAWSIISTGVICNNNSLLCIVEVAAEMTGEMSLLRYFAPTDQSTTAATESNYSIKSVDPQSSSTVLDSQLPSDSSSIIAESGSENNPSITLPVESHTVKNYSYMARTKPAPIIRLMKIN